jgi:hypothetical protein
MPPTGAPATVAPTLRGVLAGSDRAAPELRACFYREDVLRDRLREHDVQLYRADRDVVAPVGNAGTAGVAGTWRVDRVHYPGVDLPSGELSRSTGHWNPPDQWEVFEVERGEVTMLTRGPDAGDPVELVHCPAGSVLVLRPGVWHVTYAPAGPAQVSNAYTAATPGSHPGKYFSRHPTVRCGLHRDGARVAVHGDAEPVRRTAGQRAAVLPGLPPLAALFADPDPAAVARFEECCTR